MPGAASALCIRGFTTMRYRNLRLLTYTYLLYLCCISRRLNLIWYNVDTQHLIGGIVPVYVNTATLTVGRLRNCASADRGIALAPLGRCGIRPTHSHTRTLLSTESDSRQCKCQESASVTWSSFALRQRSANDWTQRTRVLLSWQHDAESIRVKRLNCHGRNDRLAWQSLTLLASTQEDVRHTSLCRTGSVEELKSWRDASQFGSSPFYIPAAATRSTHETLSGLNRGYVWNKIILKRFQNYFSEIKSFQPLKEFWHYFKINNIYEPVGTTAIYATVVQAVCYSQHKVPISRKR